MKPTNLIIFAVIIAMSGTWADKKTITQRQVVGATVAIGAFVFLSNAQPKLSGQFAWLVLASTVGAYGKDLFAIIGGVTGGTAAGTASAAKTVKSGVTSKAYSGVAGRPGGQ